MSLNVPPASVRTSSRPQEPQPSATPPVITNVTDPRKNECFTFEPGEAAARKVLEQNGTPAELTSAFPETKWLGAFQLPDGRKLASPFLAKTDMNVAYGKGDLDYATRLTQGTGFAPVALQAADGSKRAVFEVLSLDYGQDTLNKPYAEAAVAMLVAPKSTPVVVPDVNGFSTVAASAAPGVRLMNLGLVLNEQEPIDWGRQLLGLDKHAGEVEVADDDAGRDIAVSDDKGQPVFAFKDLQLSQAQQFQQAPQMAQAFGIPVEALAALPTTVASRMVHRDVNNGDVVGTAFTTAMSPEAVFNLAQGDGGFEVGASSSPLAQVLSKSDFKPEVYWHDPKALFAYGAEASVLPPPPEAPEA